MSQVSTLEFGSGRVIELRGIISQHQEHKRLPGQGFSRTLFGWWGRGQGPTPRKGTQEQSEYQAGGKASHMLPNLVSTGGIARANPYLVTGERKGLVLIQTLKSSHLLDNAPARAGA